MDSGKHLKLRRYLQEPAECAVAASASVANFYNKEIDYDYVREVANPDGGGMYTPDIAILLNKLGFRSVSVVSADINQLDFDWKDLESNALVRQLRKVGKKHSYKCYRDQAKAYVDFLTAPGYDNELIIDRHFGRYIRKYVGLGMPILASFNWNLFFEMPKWNNQNKNDPIRGEFEEHEVVICGYDDRGVHILDSHHQLYTGKLQKFSSGRYSIDWETFMTVMGFGDLIIPGEYVGTHELV